MRAVLGLGGGSLLKLLRSRGGAAMALAEEVVVRRRVDGGR